MPPPPPPPPPPPTALLSSSTASAPPLKKPVALLADIQKGTKLRKVTTNDRSAPLVTGKPSSVSSGTPSITNQLEREPKPGSGSRTYGGGGAPIGGLFANGLPSKPSENKIRRANTSVTPAAASPPPPPPMPSSGRTFASGSNNSAPLPPSIKPDLAISSKPSPPPPPVQTVKPPINSSSGGRDQFKTMRPVKSETNRMNSGLRRSGSSEDFSSRESTPARAPLARPAVPPPSRPSAPPPPPPTARTNGSYTSDPPPPPAIPPVTSALSNRFGSAPVMDVRSEESAPPPPPRSASKAGSSVGGSPSGMMPRFASKDAHPLDRFVFKPLSSLPPPPIPSQGHAY